MTRSSLSVFCFGLSLVPVGVGLVIAPNPFLAPLGFPPSGEFWPHIVGILVVLLAFYYIQAARSGLAVFFQWTVYTRTVVCGSFGVLAWLKMAPPALALLGSVDLCGAIWTELALRKDARR